MKPRSKTIIDGSTYSSLPEEEKEGFEFCGRYNFKYMNQYYRELTLDRFPVKKLDGEDADLEDIADPLFTNGFKGLLEITGKKDLREIDVDIYCKVMNKKVKVGDDKKWKDKNAICEMKYSYKPLPENKIEDLTIICGDLKYNSLSEEEKKDWEHKMEVDWKDIREACEDRGCQWEFWFNPLFKEYTDIGYLSEGFHERPDIYEINTNLYIKELKNVSYEERMRYWNEMVSTEVPIIKVFDRDLNNFNWNADYTKGSAYGLGGYAFAYETFFYHPIFMTCKDKYLSGGR